MKIIDVTTNDSKAREKISNEFGTKRSFKPDYVLSNEIWPKIKELLNLPNDVKSAEIRIAVDEVVSVKLEKIVTTESENVVKAFEEFYLVRK